ncbi:pyrophosphate--fructose 6-phosphate 1-phosphotransferase subunit alpha [Tanacetum coccineum]
MVHEALKIHNPKSTLLGFLGGSEGLFAQNTLEITNNVLATYKNKDQIRTTEQVNSAMAACKALNLDGLVIVGGVTSNTDATQLAETFAEAKCATKVNSQLISCTYALSAEKYYYFIRHLMLLWSALCSRILTWLSLLKKLLLQSLPSFDITKQICDSVQARAKQGLIESIPEVFALLQETERYGSLLTLDELKDFDMLSDDYKINWHLNHLSVINPTSEDLKSRSAKIKNHRRVFMDKLMYDGKFFSEDSMGDREPYLHHEFVGNERREEQKEQEEEEEEEEDEDDEEVEKGSMVIPIYEHEDGFVIADICIRADIQLYVDIANWTGLLWILDNFNDWYLILNMSSKYIVLILLVGRVYYGSLNSFLASFKKTCRVP